MYPFWGCDENTVLPIEFLLPRGVFHLAVNVHERLVGALLSELHLPRKGFPQKGRVHCDLKGVERKRPG